MLEKQDFQFIVLVSSDLYREWQPKTANQIYRVLIKTVDERCVHSQIHSKVW